MSIGCKEIKIIKELGKGKSGTSYLAILNNRQIVYKEMHDEQISYYKFTRNKVETELESYKLLNGTGINIPAMIHYNIDKGYIIKEYIEGATATEKIIKNELDMDILLQLINYSRIARKNGINIDYFPNNFVISENTLYYIDYEHNIFDEAWSFENWGIYYWINPKGMKKFAATGNSSYINYENTGVPIKTPELEKRKLDILSNISIE